MPRRVRIDAPTIRGWGPLFAGIPARGWGPVRVMGEDPICASSRHRARPTNRTPSSRRPRGGARGGKGGVTAMTRWRAGGPARRAGDEGLGTEGVRARADPEGRHREPPLRRATAIPVSGEATSRLVAGALSRPGRAAAWCGSAGTPPGWAKALVGSVEAPLVGVAPVVTGSALVAGAASQGGGASRRGGAPSRNEAGPGGEGCSGEQAFRGGVVFRGGAPLLCG